MDALPWMMTAEDGTPPTGKQRSQANGGKHNANSWWWAKDTQRWTALPAVQDNLDSAKACSRHQTPS